MKYHYGKTLCAMLCAVAVCMTAGAGSPEYKSAYVGQEKRRIKSLSPDDIRQLSSGKGWGLARAAELNGMPGPIHVLQMKRQISLTPAQERKIRKLYQKMHQQAVPLGRKLIALEQKLDQAFRDKSVTRASLKSMLGKIANVRQQLRYVHLSAHLHTPAILSPHQISLYNRLRGYGKDPCKSVPVGHNREMWLKHNGCK